MDEVEGYFDKLKADKALSEAQAPKSADFSQNTENVPNYEEISQIRQEVAELRQKVAQMGPFSHVPAQPQPSPPQSSYFQNTPTYSPNTPAFSQYPPTYSPPQRTFAGEFKDMLEAVNQMKAAFPTTSMSETIAQIEALQKAREKMAPEPGTDGGNNDNAMLLEVLKALPRKDPNNSQAPINTDTPAPEPPVPVQGAQGPIQPQEAVDVPIEPLTDAEIKDIVAEIRQSHPEQLKVAQIMPKSVVLKFMQRQFNLLPEEAERVYNEVKRTDEAK